MLEWIRRKLKDILTRKEVYARVEDTKTYKELVNKGLSY